jgi:hypothetical protein
VIGGYFDREDYRGLLVTADGGATKREDTDDRGLIVTADGVLPTRQSLFKRQLYKEIY